MYFLKKYNEANDSIVSYIIYNLGRFLYFTDVEDLYLKNVRAKIRCLLHMLNEISPHSHKTD